MSLSAMEDAVPVPVWDPHGLGLCWQEGRALAPGRGLSRVGGMPSSGDRALSAGPSSAPVPSGVVSSLAGHLVSRGDGVCGPD